jgi:transcriptional regulator with XRE-family HTH domain
MVRRQLGRRLRDLRVASGRTQEDVATMKIMSLGKLKQIEHGRQFVRPGDAYELGRLYGADAAELERLREMASATSAAGWWQEYGGLAKGFDTYLDLESSAARLSIFQPTVVHGLLQTEAYALAVERETADPAIAPDLAHVKVRVQRLPNLLARQRSPDIAVVLGESAMQLRVGDTEVMAGQREHLTRVAALENISIKILVHDAGPHQGMIGPFTVLDFDDPEDPSVAYIDSYIGVRYDDRQGPVHRHRAIFSDVTRKAVPLEEYLA